MKHNLRKALYVFAVISLLLSGKVFGADLLIDVRSETEYGEAHIDGSINIPVSKIGSVIRKFAPDKKTPIKLYCRSGRRSHLAKGVLEEMGYTNVSDLGGMEYARKLLKQGK